MFAIVSSSGMQKNHETVRTSRACLSLFLMTKLILTSLCIHVHLKVIPSKHNIHSDFGKRLSICNSIYINPRIQIKKGVPTLLIEISGTKVHPSGAVFLLMKAMRRNCTTILRNTKSNVKKPETYKKVK